jgi:integrase
MPLTIYKRGKFWHYRGTVAGRRLRGSTGATDKRIAERIAAEREARAWRGHLDGPEAHLTFAQAAIAYRTDRRPTRFLDAIEDYWRDTPVRDITAGAIRASAIQLYPNAGPATRNRQVIVPTQAIINHAAEMEWCPPIRVRRFPVERRSRPPATRDWVNAFAEHASPHLGALCLFMFGTGARLGEACALTWADVDLDKRTARIRQTKVGRERIAHLPTPVLVAMANIPSNRRPDEPVFRYARRDSVRPVWMKVCERAGIAPLSPHACRHGFATAMLHAGFDVKTTAERGGWSSPTVLLNTYAHAIADPTVTDAVFGTDLTQDAGEAAPSDGRKRRNRK